jgi:hypothetical protein
MSRLPEEFDIQCIKSNNGQKTPIVYTGMAHEGYIHVPIQTGLYDVNLAPSGLLSLKVNKDTDSHYGCPKYFDSSNPMIILLKPSFRCKSSAE